MGALPRPELPDGPVRVLFDELHRLHHRAGWPSLRDMAREVGCSHSTVSLAFSGPRVPRWGLLELIVETLGGDTERFHRLWLAASRATVEPVEAGRSAPLPPRQLPADVLPFAGRAEALAELDRLLDGAGRVAPALVISAVSGTAGVGKTALAVHWAHRVAGRFPDGQLYVNLRGYDPDQPVSPGDALAGFLRALGVAGPAIAESVDERAVQYRTLLAGRRMLVVLDNAGCVDQVRDLLPGSPSCFVLVTSRDRLPGLVVRHGAVRIGVDVLTSTEAVTLLAALIGARVAAEPDQAAALARRCARLPLALRIAAELVAARPTATLADLVRELGGRRCLDLLEAGGDERTAVRAVLSWSYRQLSPDAARLFQLLGLHPGDETDAYASAALAGTDLPAARRLLDLLCRVHLVQETRPGRFAMHDLLRAYARELLAGHPDADRRSALDRLCDAYLYMAALAMDAAFPGGPLRHPRLVAGWPVPPIGTGAQARFWLETERGNLLATAAAVVADRPSYVYQLADVLAGYLDAGGFYQEAQTLYEDALKAARAAGDRVAEGGVLSLLAGVLRRVGRYGAAGSYYRRALVAHRAGGDRAGEAVTLHGLARVDWRLGRYERALAHYQAARAIYRELGDRGGEGTALAGLGIVYRRMGRYERALAQYRQALASHQDAGDRAGVGRDLCNLGVVLVRLGRYAEAIDHYHRSLAVDRELGHRTGQGVALGNLGTVYQRLGRPAEAIEHHERALAIHREVGYRVGEGEALHGLGAAYAQLSHHAEALQRLRQGAAIGRELGEAELETAALNDISACLQALGRNGEAQSTYRTALARAKGIGDRYQTARALAGLADGYRYTGNHGRALRYWQRAHAIYEDLGVPEADEVAHAFGPTAHPNRHWPRPLRDGALPLASRVRIRQPPRPGSNTSATSTS